jgi:hypothetical protein
MARYLLLQYYCGAPAPVDAAPMNPRTPNRIPGQVQYLDDLSAALERMGEFIEGQMLAFEGALVRYDGQGRPPVIEDLSSRNSSRLAGWMVIDVDTYERAVEVAGELSVAQRVDGVPIHKWIGIRRLLAAGTPTTMDWPFG